MKSSPLSRRHFIAITGAAAVSLPLFAQNTSAPAMKPPTAFQVGDFKKIYDPSVGEKEQWYINDHTFIRAEDGTWHLFGITHPEPANPEEERIFAHATAPDPMGPWTKQPNVLPYDPSVGETHVWAPHVIHNDGQYWMYYCGGSDKHETYRIQLATSKDLFKWERSPANPMLQDGFDARDPMVARVGDEWVLYYCATSAPGGGNHNVKAVTSKDLVHWANPREVFRNPEVGTSGGPTESPFLVQRNGKYYLFVCTNVDYKQSAAYVSDSPFHWDFANQVGLFPAHAAEVVHTPDDKWYVSGAGWGQGGVYLAELKWRA